MDRYDLAIVGAGIAGASAGYEIADAGSAVLLERESQPGYHTTGRSAALYMESYGTPAIRALTRAGRAFYDHPPEVLGTDPILAPRGALHVAGPHQQDLLEAAWKDLSARSGEVRRVDRAEIAARVPVLRPEAASAGIAEDGAADIDVHPLHQGYLRGFHRRGAAAPSHSPRPRAWTPPAGPRSPASARPTTSSPTQACCRARPPTPTR